MDRNYYADKDCDWVRVALRKESVDRNIMSPIDVMAVSVALRKESVDRNIYIAHHLLHEGQSLSARRAWIEMPDPAHGFRDA